eukprot:GILI01003777.1.p1 GENE.GILI01003777.1~~GILI01003777.1.p1  ORF type:complete len:549 (-),score=158.41 GILI01003777.1:229-1803(-)
MTTIFLDGESLTPEILWELGQGKLTLDLSEEAWTKVGSGRKVVDDILERGDVVYGINTGFGNFSNVVIPADKLGELQVNLIRSHAAGVGEPLSLPQTRMLMALRANVLAKGHSGIRPETLKHLLKAFNCSCLPFIPCQGTVGASGDLAPLAHLALGLIGEGKMWNPSSSQYEDSGKVLRDHGLQPIELGPKEGLALINGTQLIAALGCEALVRAENAARVADIVCALSLEALKGSVRAYHPSIHNARPHPGQIKVATRLRSLLHSPTNPSEISLSHVNCGKVQDSYTMRCAPQVHGIVTDTLNFVRSVLQTEINSATDNPMVFAEPDVYNPEMTSFIISGGNFHGEYPAKVLDYLAIGIHELANMSERRIERLVNPQLSSLPAFLTPGGGLNSGFMIAHCTAAALVSENKVLCHPSSVDSLSTSAAKEDHVSMGGWSARKAIRVVEHVETVLAIELLCGCQAIDMLRPLTSTQPLEKVYSLVREKVRPWDQDRYMAPDIEVAKALVRLGDVWNCVADFIPAEAL